MGSWMGPLVGARRRYEEKGVVVLATAQGAREPERAHFAINSSGAMDLPRE